MDHDTPREQLIERARALGVERPEVMTRPELRDEIVRRTELDELSRRAARGWFGVARDLVASVVERRLHLPDAAEVIRAAPLRATAWVAPVATVTLAEIYASQGHERRALKMLGEVLDREPDHEPARRLQERLTRAAGKDSPETLEREEARSAPPPGSIEPTAARWEGAARVPDEATASRPTIVPTVDALWYVRSSSGALIAYWELSPESQQREQAHQPAGQRVLRVVVVDPDDLAREAVLREWVLPQNVGSTELPVAADGMELRAAAGWRAGGEFRPLALGVELGTSEPWWSDVVAADGPAARAVAQAKERAIERLPSSGTG